MLSLDWYTKAPIDFEHKNYLLLDYIMKVDESYSNLKLSPYLLWTEKLVMDMEIFMKEHNNLKSEMRKTFERIEGFSIVYSQPEIPKEVLEILEIVEYSKPILESKVKIGYKLFKKYPQLLF
jgi:hypothetical protein